MSETQPPAEEVSTDDYTSDDAACDRPEYETVDEETRKEMLETYDYRCQTCGRYGPQNGGMATLHVHHLDRDPDKVGLHDPDNLTVLCVSCHNWHHHPPERDAVPVELDDADESEMLRQDYEILQLLDANGPMRTGDIVDQLSVDQSALSIRERLWQLMGLDKAVDGRDQPLVDKDAETGEWGLLGQIERSARGGIPMEPKTLFQRIEDEQIRQALDRGIDRDIVIDVFDVSERTTFRKETRARAYDFPLDALRNSRNGGRPPKSATTTPASTDGDSTGDGDEAEDTTEELTEEQPGDTAATDREVTDPESSETDHRGRCG